MGNPPAQRLDRVAEVTGNGRDRHTLASIELAHRADLEVPSDGRTIVGIVVPFDEETTIADRGRTYTEPSPTRTPTTRSPSAIALGVAQRASITRLARRFMRFSRWVPLNRW